jgi:hypothetical protein
LGELLPVGGVAFYRIEGGAEKLIAVELRSSNTRRKEYLANTSTLPQTEDIWSKSALEGKNGVPLITGSNIALGFFRNTCLGPYLQPMTREAAAT